MQRVCLFREASGTSTAAAPPARRESPTPSPTSDSVKENGFRRPFGGLFKSLLFCFVCFGSFLFFELLYSSFRDFFFGYFYFALLSFMHIFFSLSPSMHMLFPFLSLSPFASFFLFWALGVCLESQTIFFAESFLFYSSITKLQMNSIF